MGLNDPIMPPRVTAQDAYKPKHTDGKLASEVAAAEARIWLEAARMAEEEAKKTQAEAPHWPLWGDPDRDFASALAARLRAAADASK